MRRFGTALSNKLLYPVSGGLTRSATRCVYVNGSALSSWGVTTIAAGDAGVTCLTTHLSSFTVVPSDAPPEVDQIEDVPVAVTTSAAEQQVVAPEPTAEGGAASSTATPAATPAPEVEQIEDEATTPQRAVPSVQEEETVTTCAPNPKPYTLHLTPYPMNPTT
jgi:hypothetical protein